MTDKQVRPLVFVYDTNRDKYSKYSHQYRFMFGNPTFFRNVETLRYDFIIANEQRIIDAYAKYGIKHLELGSEIKSKPPKEAVETLKEEDGTTLPPQEDNASQELTESVEEDLESLSWAELRKKAREAGLEGQFGKEEAIQFLKSK